LVVAPSWVGDAAMATPALRAIREAWPAAHITVLCRPGIDRLLAGLPSFDEMIVDRLGGLLGPLRARRRLAAVGAGVAVLFPNSFRTALATAIAGIPRRVGIARDGRRWLLTDPIPGPQRGVPASTVNLYCDLVERGLGIPVPDRTIRLALTDSDRDAAARILAEVPRPFALLIPGGNRADKRWPAERFAAVAGELVRRHGLAVAVSGSPAERPTINAVRAAASVPIADLAARGLDLGALKGVVAAAGLVVTNDTGPRHLAAAFDVPAVALFGPTDPRWTLLPGARERLVVAEPFLPDDRSADDHPAACRIERIAIPDVLSAIDLLLMP
jgi:heptosyltransferase-2